MASLLADGLNLGQTRMAEACTIASLGQLAWVADWHIRDEVGGNNGDPNTLYFADGINGEANGLFGAIFANGSFIP